MGEWVARPPRGPGRPARPAHPPDSGVLRDLRDWLGAVQSHPGASPRRPRSPPYALSPSVQSGPVAGAEEAGAEEAGAEEAGAEEAGAEEEAGWAPWPSQAGLEPTVEAGRTQDRGLCPAQAELSSTASDSSVEVWPACPPPAQPAAAGFTSGSGRPIELSEWALAQAQRRWDQLGQTEEEDFHLARPNPGASAVLRPLAASAGALASARSLWPADRAASTSACPAPSVTLALAAGPPAPPSVEIGFQSGRGRTLALSHAAVVRAQRMWAESQAEERPTPRPTLKPIPVPPAAWARARSLWADIAVDAGPAPALPSQTPLGPVSRVPTNGVRPVELPTSPVIPQPATPTGLSGGGTRAFKAPARLGPRPFTPTGARAAANLRAFQSPALEPTTPSLVRAARVPLGLGPGTPSPGTPTRASHSLMPSITPLSSRSRQLGVRRRPLAGEVLVRGSPIDPWESGESPTLPPAKRPKLPFKAPRVSPRLRPNDMADSEAFEDMANQIMNELETSDW